jgi:ADP-ribose pyrophosphatase
MDEITLNSEQIYQGRILDLYKDSVQLSNGKKATREVVRHNPAVAVLPVSGSEITLVKQFRYSTGEILYEAVAGNIETGEEPIKAAERELAEEAGFKAEKLELIFTGYSAPGFCDELMYFYLATGLSEYKLPADEDEEIETVTLTLKEAKVLLKQGKIKDNKTGLFIFYLESINGKAAQ